MNFGFFSGECRPGCENLPRDVTVNTNYGRVNGFYVYLYDGPRVPEFDRPGYANVDKPKFRVSVFLGIPYAQPPTGEARLMVRFSYLPLGREFLLPSYSGVQLSFYTYYKSLIELGLL